MKAIPKPVDLAAIQRRAEAATPGPWETWMAIVPPHEHGVRTMAPEPDVGPLGRVLAYWRGWDPAPQDRADVEFVAHARQDVPALLGLVQEMARALAVVEWPEDECWEICRSCDGERNNGHAVGCKLDALLTMAGLDTPEKREAARGGR